jgi:uncharacterized membrane protein
VVAALAVGADASAEEAQAVAGRREVPGELKHHLRESDLDAIARCVDSAESGTAAEIRVHINHSLGFLERPRKKAVRVFFELGMDKTSGRTGLLLFLSLQERRIEIVGDSGVLSQVSNDSWNKVVNEMQQEILQKGLVPGICSGIDRIGRILSAALPRTADDRNELSNTVSEE